MTDAILEFFSVLPDWLYVLVISMLPIVELRGAIPVGAGIGMAYYLCYPLAVLGNMLPVPFILLFIPRILDFMARFKIFRPIVTWLRKKADKHSKRVLKGESDGAHKSLTDPEVESQTDRETELITRDSEPEIIDSTSLSAKADKPKTESKNATRPATCGEDTPISNDKRTVTRSLFIALILFVAIPLPGTGAWTGGLVSSLFNFERGRSALAIFLGVLISGVVMSLVSYGVLGFLSFLI